MDETKQRESVYSSERTETTGPHSLRGTTATAESGKSEKAEPALEPTQSAEIRGIPGTTKQTSAAVSPVNASPVSGGRVNPRTEGNSLFADLPEYLKRTRYVWFGLAGAAIIFMFAVTVIKGMAERARIAREKRHEEAAATATPENLLTRCGPPAEDVTKEIYPVLTRTMIYQPRQNEKMVLEFSRTAEEKSDWVFLSMKDESGTRSFDTPEAKIAALPCMDSKK
jgi:hypothetical protein